MGQTGQLCVRKNTAAYAAWFQMFMPLPPPLRLFKHRYGWMGKIVAILLVCASTHALAQKPGISIGRTELSPGQTFTITASAEQELAVPPLFPDVAGMPKQGSSSSSSTTIINGQVSSTYSITQRYLAKSEGKFIVKPFAMKLNGKAYTHPGVVVTVKKGAGEDIDPATVYDPFEDFFGSRRNASYKEIKENAFLALDASKDQVWVGEGFTLTLSLFVAEDNRADMDFYDLTGQMSAIIKQIKPPSCWEESFGITDIEPRRAVINGKTYQEYRIWQSAFYPLDAKSLKFPRIGLKMIKYQQAADPFAFGGMDKRQSFKTFYAKPFTIKVKEVPPSPYGRPLPVGDFRLAERIGRGRVETGQSVSYQFIIKGEGNISAIEMPVPPSTPQMDVYPPTMQQNILREAGRVTGSKTLTYLLQPRREGKYPLARQGFVFPFFNPAAGRYDSLRSRITLTSFGTAKESSTNSTADAGNYLSNRLIYLDNDKGMEGLWEHRLAGAGAGHGHGAGVEAQAVGFLAEASR